MILSKKLDSKIELTKVLPRTHKSVQILAGDGKSVGTVRLWNFVSGTTNARRKTTEKIVSMDDESRTLIFSLIGGEAMQLYKTIQYTMSAAPIKGNEQSCLVKWTLDYEKQNDDVPPPNHLVEFATYIIEGIASHLLKKA
ncbi:MLP-like protein 423 [Papaver somniferum]|uniref:MLP-like protein 423 n=1 Tax=Papaver somniferum TaxID=3469 RepID=UPI000E6F9A40|nr:MLP-like protein 423 [Papaver somniferum]